mgnify:CR=1 FL=1
MKKVLVGGCFDLLHYGHIAFLRESRSLGDWLMVALESDENVRYMKGPTRPIHTQDQRKVMLKTLSCVDHVIPLNNKKTNTDYTQLVERVNPAVIAITEGDPIEEKKRLQAAAVGAEFVVIPKVRTPSTSQLAKLLELE